MNLNQHLALHHVVTRDQQPGDAEHLYRHFARVDERRRRRERFISLIRRQRSWKPAVPPRVRMAT